MPDGRAGDIEYVPPVTGKSATAYNAFTSGLIFRFLLNAALVTFVVGVV